MYQTYFNENDSETDSDYTNNSEEVFISKIRVIYDEKFKNFVKKLKEDLAEDISNLDRPVFEACLPVQEKIREYIIENQDSFNKSGSKRISENAKPDLFAIAICILIENLDNYNNFNEILKVTHEGVWSLSLFSSDDINGNTISGSFKCVCSQDCLPQNMYIASNSQTELNLLIGSECAKKTGFFEPEVIDKLKKERDDNPLYKKFLEETEKKNREIRISKLDEGLKKINLSIDIIIKNKDIFEYIGGNNGEDLENLQKYFTLASMDQKESCDFMEDMKGVESCVCEQKIKNKLFVMNNDDADTLCLCKTCCQILNINIPKSTKGYCEDCGEKHKNKKDNYCHSCRKKKNCISCGIREFCNDNDLCSECSKKPCKTCKKKGNYIYDRCEECSNSNYCADCDNQKVSKKGWRCQSCFNKLKKCSCGKIIKNLKFTNCYDCNSLNRNNRNK